MSHIVRYRGSDGEERFEDAPSLDGALERSEALRNEAGVSDVRLYREIKVEFKTYYKATVVEGDAPAPASDEPASAPRPQATVSEPPPGAMPLGSSRPAPAPSADGDADDQDAQPASSSDEGQSKRTLFSRG